MVWVKEIQKTDLNKTSDEYEKYYSINEQGDYEHSTFHFSCKDYFNLSQFVLDELES